MLLQRYWEIHLVSKWVYKSTVVNHVTVPPKMTEYSSSRDDDEAETLLLSGDCILSDWELVMSLLVVVR